MRIQNSINKIYDFLNNLLEWAKLQQDQINPTQMKINLSIIIESTIDLYREPLNNKGITTKYNIYSETDDVQLNTDGNMLSAILRNLLNNAIKFSPNHAKITIEAMKTTGQDIRFSVKDEEPGIEEKNVDTTFDINKKKYIKSADNNDNKTGSGMGLVISKNFVNKPGGDIWYKNNNPGGTTFYFTIKKDLNYCFNESRKDNINNEYLTGVVDI